MEKIGPVPGISVYTKGVNSCNALSSDLGWNKCMKVFVVTILIPVQNVGACSFTLGRLEEELE